ncbi:MAG TPA: hypothetical protein VFC54_05470 [Pseudolabrys sp.]|nr:hypothetical protein [Pseudolabrys sp.]
MTGTSEVFASVLNRLKRFKIFPAIQRFAAHNRRVFPLAPDAARRKPVVLFELNLLRSAHIAYSYCANVLATEHRARIVAYAPQRLQSWRQRLYFWIKCAIGLDPFGAYTSFGTTGFLEVVPSTVQKAKAKELIETVLPLLRNKRDVEELVIDGVLVGDLIYDSYLSVFRKPTIEFDSSEFQHFLLNSLELYVFWNDYFNTQDVRAINVSHCVYTVAIPLRLALKRGIPAFQANVTHIYRLTERNLFAYNDFFYFPERFAALPSDVREAGLAEAERRIKRRFAGEVGVDMGYSTKSAYGENRYARLLQPSQRKKILIATHCFFDSPHGYGNNLFPDFYEWLSFLGEISEATDYDWYIKTHPDYLDGTKEIIDALVAKYPKFTLLPADASHHQIIAEGIDLALTTWGTIAFEYAALGIPVINASRNNPHIAYDFNLHAKGVEDYRRMLLNLDRLDLKIDKRKVCEYYFMRNIYNTEDLFFESYDKAVDDLGGYSGQFEVEVYDRWLQDWSPERHRTIVAALRAFVRSGDFRMDYTHYGREFTFESTEGQV